tara:strand:- start:9 stop:182 length:174 start_codon:yes stop_codon:yes gene_type:complete
MKAFSCGDVVPGCDARFVRSTEEEVLADVARHARSDHGMVEIGDDLARTVRSLIVAA